MSDLKIKIPSKITDEFPDIEWDKVAERAVLEEFKRRLSLKVMDELLEESELTDEDIERLSKKVNEQVKKKIERNISS
ncbi:MAG: hypothetical protein ACQESD_04930 [Thermoplasmatota archaeon]